MGCKWIDYHLLFFFTYWSYEMLNYPKFTKGKQTLEDFIKEHYNPGVLMSKPGKMPCRCWSLESGPTCPGAKNKDRPSGTEEVCEGCYSWGRGMYVMSNVKAPRIHNMLDWERVDWAEDVVKEMDVDRYIRWFDSGDCYHIRLARKIYWIMKMTPWVRHWLPTKMHKFAKFRVVFEAMAKLPNVTVRYSAYNVGQGLEATYHIPARSAVHVGDVVSVEGHHKCWVGEKIGQDKAGKDIKRKKCGTCRVCWDSSVDVSYDAHGQGMKKVIVKFTSGKRELAA
jgi:hypothetical protein